ncbi:MAG TPA: TolC family protein [Bryobacteraceae bacterium]|nr:TolC family protein [Bryobacteraceae bacterium]HXJ44149.1 TolC family protein [Bryobacteraceae bacterium]
MSATLRRGTFCLFAFALANVRAEEGTFGPKELFSELLQRNPEIQAARSRFEAATKRPSQAGTLPEPTASFTNFGVGHPFSRLNGSNFAYQGFGVSQEFPFPGKLALASEQAKLEAEGVQQNYRAVVLNVTARLKVAYYEWLTVNKAIELARKHSDLLSRFEEIARNRYTVGKGLQQDVLKAQLEVSSLEQQLTMLNEKRQRAEAEIASLLAIPAVVMRAPGEIQASSFSMSLDELLQATADSPRVRAEQKMVDARAVGINRSLKDFRPDFDVNLQWQHTGSNFPDYYMATVEVKIPIYYARKQRYALEESYSKLREAKQNYQAAQQQSIYQVKDQYLSIQSSARILNLYKTTLIPQAQLTVDSSASAYEVGSIDFLTLLTNLTNLISLDRQYYDELARHEEAIAKLEPIVGKELVPFRETNQ